MEGSGDCSQDDSGKAGSMESSLPGSEVARRWPDLARVERIVPLAIGARQGGAPRGVHFLTVHAGGTLRVWRSDGAASLAWPAKKSERTFLLDDRLELFFGNMAHLQFGISMHPEMSAPAPGYAPAA